MDFGTDLVLVTGATGWLGRSFIRALTSGLPDVEALRQPNSHLRIRCQALPGPEEQDLRKLSDRIELMLGDVRRKEDCEAFCRDARGAVLFHTVGIIHPRRVHELYDINVEGTKNILAAAKAAGIRRVVAVSSNSPCGCNPHPEHQFDETAPDNPYMHYGRSKLLMERAIREVQQSGAMETVIVRPTWFYGPYQPPRQSLFFRMIRDGKMPIVGGGVGRRSMTYIDNLCQGLILVALTERANGQTYWIADERPYSMNEIVDTVERLLETEFGQICTHKRIRLPGLASEVAWLVDKMLQGLGLYNQKIHVLSEMNKTIACSVAKAERELGYTPKIALEEGMRRSLTWLVNEGGGV
jgi:nucleoside-diphosphate-sugar epimerase